jgi:hypothetical protein
VSGVASCGTQWSGGLLVSERKRRVARVYVQVAKWRSCVI